MYLGSMNKENVITVDYHITDNSSFVRLGSQIHYCRSMWHALDLVEEWYSEAIHQGMEIRILEHDFSNL